MISFSTSFSTSGVSAFFSADSALPPSVPSSVSASKASSKFNGHRDTGFSLSGVFGRLGFRRRSIVTIFHLDPVRGLSLSAGHLLGRLARQTLLRSRWSASHNHSSLSSSRCVSADTFRTKFADAFENRRIFRFPDRLVLNSLSSTSHSSPSNWIVLLRSFPVIGFDTSSR